MSLEEEIKTARKKIVTDGYEMSIGELISLYKEGEVHVDPDYQRLFRWSETQKTRFVESILLGIPIPPIFVFQTKNGTWELVDGLQRMSTVLEFIGELKGPDGDEIQASVLEGTELLPSLAGKSWASSEADDPNALTINQQLQVKRARIRVEILKNDSDADAKFELFQRLNTGGSILSEQEVRNCVLVMLNRDFFRRLQRLSTDDALNATFPATEKAASEQKPIEMVLRFLAHRRIEYQRGLDVNEYLDRAAKELSKISEPELEAEEEIFRWTFGELRSAMGDGAFRKWDGTRHVGAPLLSAFEVIAVGVAANRDSLILMDAEPRHEQIKTRARGIWTNTIFTENSGMGVRGTTRLATLIPFGKELFNP